ncbi:MAG: metallophosphoesterase [Armatimonadota bacterium]|nr:metallophosphoesterase [Armatimonadota bacterium]
MLIEGAAVFGAAACAYGFLIEAYRLGLTELEFKFDRLPREFDGFKILHLTDLHLKKETRIQNICLPILEKKLRALIAGRSFDMVAITGDLELRGKGFEGMRDLLESIPSKHGAFFVPGNGEYQDYNIDILLEALDSWGVKTLRNDSCVIEHNGASVRLVGVDDPFTKHSDLDKAMLDVRNDEFKLLLSHSPAIAREAIRHKIDLILSGHTHGGQVQFPFTGALYTHLGRGAPRLAHGVYEGRRLSARTGMDAGPMKVYVSRGVGMSDFFIRFLCPPEIAVITLRAA